MTKRPAWIDAGPRRLRRALGGARGFIASTWTMNKASYRIFTGFIVYAAAIPFAGWGLPTVWFSTVVALIVAQRAWIDRPGTPDRAKALEPFPWLLSAAYSLAAFYLAFRYDRAAQTLGVTLLGVTMFQVLAVEYAAPRRLAANLLAPIAAILVLQLGATLLLVREAEPWKIVTLLASPLVVLRTFLAVKHNLSVSLEAQRSATAQLAESETRYRLLAERSPDVIVRYDLEGRVEYLSPAARAYGWDPDKAVGANLADALDPEDLERNDRLLAELASGGAASVGDQNVWRARAAEGRLVWFEGRSSAIHDDAGRAMGAIAVLRDVTERKAMEDELRAKRAEAEAAAVAKSQFLANMSHEVRTPLTGVIGFAGLLEAMPDLSPTARRYVSRIGASAETLLAVVNDVLEFSKLEAGQIELDLQPFDPQAEIEAATDLVRDQAEAKRLTLHVEWTKPPPSRIVGDAARLRQVLLNLLTNAVKFTDAGSVCVRASHRRGRLKVTVRDTGPGVPSELAGRLFQRFSQIDGSNARRHGGTGLGLAISKGLVEVMGGEIGLQRASGPGAAFWFSVPAPEAPEELASPAQAPTADLALERVRILVVDDVAVNRELISTILLAFEVEVVQASSGAEAIEAALTQAFDVILMDLQMPGMDGFAAAAAIRAHTDLNRSTPILAISANVLPADVEASLAAGMNDHICKPIDPRDLILKIAKWTDADAPFDAALSARDAKARSGRDG